MSIQCWRERNKGVLKPRNLNTTKLANEFRATTLEWEMRVVSCRRALWVATSQKRRLRLLSLFADTWLVDDGATGSAHPHRRRRRVACRSPTTALRRGKESTLCRSIPLHFWTGNSRPPVEPK